MRAAEGGAEGPGQHSATSLSPAPSSSPHVPAPNSSPRVPAPSSTPVPGHHAVATDGLGASEGHTTPINAFESSHIAYPHNAVTPSVSVSVPGPHQPAPGLGSEWQGVAESRVQGLNQSTSESPPPLSDVPPQHAIEVISASTLSPHLNKIVQMNVSVPDRSKTVSQKSTLRDPLSIGNAFSKFTLEDEKQGVTTSLLHPWHPSTDGLYARTTGPDEDHRKQQNAGKATQENTQGLCDNTHGMFIVYLYTGISMLKDFYHWYLLDIGPTCPH